ncbi:MAG TPA: M48 family metallopeptidase [Mycobacteriales bacterium]|nr:M48 family metallopeptidase [Mycobacteriales bacterium]
MSTPTRPDDELRPAPVRTDPSREAVPSAPLAAPRSSVAGRAALALALLVGYFVLAAAVVGGLLFLTVQAFATGGSGVVSTKLAVFTGLVALAVGRAVFSVEQRGENVEDGVRVSRTDQPELWGLVDEVSAELGVPAPDDLRVVDDVNAFVHQDTRLLGLVGGDRHMGIGAGLLQVLTVDQLRGVVGHELGHYAGGDTRLSSLVYRAGATVERTADQLGRDTLLGRLFARYAALYARVSLAVRRRQELRADEGSVRVVGREVHGAALREVQAGAAAWSFFGDRYVVPLWQAGTAPADMFVGFRELLADPVRQLQLDEVRTSDEGPADPYDSHPTLTARLDHLSRLPDRMPPGDERPARALLREPESLERRVTEQVNASVLRELPRQRYAFAGELDATPYVAGLEGHAAALSRATAAVDGLGAPAGLGRTLALFEAGRDADLVTALTGDRRDLGEQARATDLRNVVGGPFALSAALALVDAGGARWQASWAQPVQLVDADGEPLEVSAALEEALDNSGVPGLRPALDELGVPLDDAALAPAADAAPEQDHTDAVVAVWPDLVRGRARFDAVVTRDLLVLVRQPKRWSTTLRRGLASQYGVGKGGLREAAGRRVRALLELPPEQLASRPDAHAFRWDDLPAVGFKGGLATAWVLLLPGQPKPFDKLKAEDDALVPGPEQTAALLRQLVGGRLDSSL